MAVLTATGADAGCSPFIGPYRHRSDVYNATDNLFIFCGSTVQAGIACGVILSYQHGGIIVHFSSRMGIVFVCMNFPVDNASCSSSRRPRLKNMKKPEVRRCGFCLAHILCGIFSHRIVFTAFHFSRPRTNRHSVDSHSLLQTLCGQTYVPRIMAARRNSRGSRTTTKQHRILVLSVEQRSDVNVRSSRRRFTRCSWNYNTIDMHRVAVKNRRLFALFRAFSHVFHSDSMYSFREGEVNRPLTFNPILMSGKPWRSVDLCAHRLHPTAGILSSISSCCISPHFTSSCALWGVCSVCPHFLSRQLIDFRWGRDPGVRGSGRNESFRNIMCSGPLYQLPPPTANREDKGLENGIRRPEPESMVEGILNRVANSPP